MKAPNMKRPPSVKKKQSNLEFQESNINALDLDIHQSTDNLQKLLIHYKKEDQEDYGKVVDDFVTNLENEIIKTEKKSPFLDSLDLGSSNHRSKPNDDLGQKNNQTFGVKNIDFSKNINFSKNIEKMNNFSEKQSLEEMIGYISEDSDNEENEKMIEIKKASNFPKPFSANNISRNELTANLSKPIQTEYHTYISNPKNQKILFNNNNISKDECEAISKKPSGNNNLPPKCQNEQRTKRAPSCEPQPKSQDKEKNSKFRNKLLDDIESSKYMKTQKNYEKPASQGKKRISCKKKDNSAHVFIF